MAILHGTKSLQVPNEIFLFFISKESPHPKSDTTFEIHQFPKRFGI